MYKILTQMIQDGVVQDYCGSFAVVRVDVLRNQTVRKNTRFPFQVVAVNNDQTIIGKFRGLKEAKTACQKASQDMDITEFCELVM